MMHLIKFHVLGIPNSVYTELSSDVSIYRQHSQQKSGKLHTLDRACFHIPLSSKPVLTDPHANHGPVVVA